MRTLSFLSLLLIYGCDASNKPGTDTSAVVVDDGDADADGFTVDEGDCDDANADVSPSATEVCDGIDNDCDDVVDDGVEHTWYADVDSDGYGDADAPVEACEQPGGSVSTGTDCDDNDANAYPS